MFVFFKSIFIIEKNKIVSYCVLRKNKGLTSLEYLLIINGQYFTFLLEWRCHIHFLKRYKGRHEVESRWYLKKQVHKEGAGNCLNYLHTMERKVSMPSDIDLIFICLRSVLSKTLFQNSVFQLYVCDCILKLWVSQLERTFLWLQSWHCIPLVFLPLS